jgi:glutathione S-transferase
MGVPAINSHGNTTGKFTMKLYGCANSRSLRATWALEHAGAEYDYIHVDLFAGEGRQPPFLAMNPAGKVPVLIDEALTLTESAAIVTYVGEKFPSSGLVPTALVDRADYLRWCSFIITELEQPLWSIARHRFILPPEQRVPAIEPVAIREFEHACGLLSAHLESSKFIQKQIFTGCDILAAHTLAWARSARIPLAGARINDYLDEVYGSPSAARARARERAAAPRK